MKPEEKARIKIDQMFEDAGWKVMDRDFYSPTITAAAIREGLLKGNDMRHPSRINSFGAVSLYEGRL